MIRSKRSLSTMALVLTAALLGAACGKSSGSGVALTGAGATFPQPIYDTWFKDFQKVESGAKVNYQAIGSGGGVTQFTSKTVDFGASDAPLKDDEQAALPAPALEIPTVIGGVVIAYNVSGIQSGLKLDGATAADIFLGKVKTWNSPEITALNPDLTNLPPTPIQVVHRADESGTTKVFTSWLSAASPEWSSSVGADKAVQWPTGTGANGNDGVAAGISQTDGSVGYLSYDFAVTSNLGIADIKADDGTYITPSVDTISAAGASLQFPITQDTSILNSSAPGSYPISTTTYLLVYKAQADKDKGQTLVDFIYWALTKGQAEVKALNYAPLPSGVQQQALALLGQITSGGKAITPSPKVKNG